MREKRHVIYTWDQACDHPHMPVDPPPDVRVEIHRDTDGYACVKLTAKGPPTCMQCNTHFEEVSEP